MTPDTLFWAGLVLKIAFTAGIVVTATLVVERTGPFFGALVAAFPTSALAAYIILGIEHPPAFVAQSAVGSLVANAVTAVYMLVYAAAAPRHGLLASLLPALLLWGIGVALATTITWTLASACLLVAVVYTITVAASHRQRSTEARAVPVPRRRYEILIRALIVGVFVAVVTAASHRIGSLASGIFAVFPIAMTSFIVILHTRVSGAVAGRTIAHAQVTMVGLNISFIVLALAAEPFGPWLALTAQIATCTAFTLALWAWHARA